MISTNLHELLDRARRAVWAMLQAAIALFLALIIILANLLRAAFDGLRMMGEVIVRALCVAGCAFGVAYGIDGIGRAFGGDMAAYVMAGTLLVVPIAYVLARGVGWGGLLLAGGVAFVAGEILPVVHPVLRAAALGTALGTGIISQAKMEVGNEQGTR